MRSSALCLTAISMAAAAPLAAQPTDVPVKAGKEWKHKATGIRLPPTLAGLARDSMSTFGNPETDVWVNYWSADRADNVTVFLYRNVNGNAPLWFDRARSLITLLPQKYRNPRSSGIRAFTPRGQRNASGLMEVLATDSDYRSTGLILFPVNGFYAKIRASSSSRDPAAIEHLMLAAANAIDWSSRQVEAVAVPILDCPAPLPRRQPAKLAATSKDDRMMSALIGGLMAQVATTKAVPANIIYCREPGQAQIPYGLYRANSSNAAYTMALLDAGRSVAVGESGVTQIMTNATPRISVTFIDLDKTATFGDFASLPLPEQVVEMIEKTRPLSVATTWGDKRRDVSINAQE